MELIPAAQLNDVANLTGASSATQWYCPPDVGALVSKSETNVISLTGVTYIEAISAKEAQVASEPKKDRTSP